MDDNAASVGDITACIDDMVACVAMIVFVSSPIRRNGSSALASTAKPTTSTDAALVGAANILPTLASYAILSHLPPPDPRPARVLMSVVLATGSMISTALALYGAANTLPTVLAYVIPSHL